MSITEIIFLSIDPSENLSSPSSPVGQTWTELLTLASHSPGFLSHAWSRGFEEPRHVRLHIVRAALENHTAFHNSPSGQRFAALLENLGGAEVFHASLTDINTSALAAPLTGTALYISTTPLFEDLVWPLWTHITRHMPGCLGITSGKILDHKSGKPAFLVYVGWENLEAHRAYWEGSEIDDKRGILEMGHGGRTEFYHVVFDRGVRS